MPKKLRAERVGDDLANGLDVGGRDRRGPGVVPQLEAVFLDEIGVAGCFAHDSSGDVLLVVHAASASWGDQRGAGGGVGEAAEFVVGEEAVGVGLGGHQADLEVGQPGRDHRYGQAVAADRLEGDADGRQRGGVESSTIIHIESLRTMPQAMCQTPLEVFSSVPT